MQHLFFLSAKSLGLLFLSFILSETALHANPADQVARLYEDSNQPILVGRGSFFADIDTVDQIIYTLVYEELWSYDLKTDEWNFLHSFDDDVTDELFDQPKEFGFDQVTGDLYLWSVGVGLVYRINLQNYEVTRLDQSFPHKNQFGHTPFFREGMIYAFGGYGLWQNKNLITHFVPNLREWKIVTPAEKSPFPKERSNSKGMYVPDQQSFYIYGGNVIEGRPHDDSNSNHTWKNNLWKFDFNTMEWSYVMKTEPLSGWPMRNNAISTLSGVSLTSLSSTAFSLSSGNWYIPVRTSGSSQLSLYLKTFDLKDHTEYKLIDLDLTVEEEMFATHVLFDQKSKELILLGYHNRSNQELFPVIVKKIPEQRLLEKLEPVGPDVTLVYASALGFGLLLILGLLYLKFGSAIPAIEDKKQFSKDKLEEELNETERSLLNALCNADYMPETNELEELVWPDVDNYDYRRKLRNETIRSVNEKVQETFGVNEKLIIREKDIEDNRRFRYGVRREILD
ncbi:hypothetical protein ACKGJO_12720 [Gracilimonas sp. Q87]|uniref:hypothetical protein n=1 Tax=Gracilimonas sp. Q87 TaxID=3384766 RepID=UPI0039842C43